MELPADRKYTKDHEWVFVTDGVATVGITEFAQGELGELVFVDLPAVGKKVTHGVTACVVESTKAASDVYAPISGTVSEVNTALSASPSLVNSDPYSRGWLYKLSGVSPAETSTLMNADAYKQLIGR